MAADAAGSVPGTRLSRPTRRPRPRRCTSGSTRSVEARRRAPWRRRPRTPIFCAARISISMARFPTRPTARAFLDDPSPTKRQAAGRSLAGARPQFARHMAQVFDVLLMERRRRQGRKTGAEWQEYLRQEFCRQQAARSVGPRDPGGRRRRPALRPAAKFYLDRDGDANLLARDIGRLFFGRDLQCAQCHDHPLVDDYLQVGLLRADGVRQPRHAVHRRQGQEDYYAENGRRRSELQIGVHRRSPRPRGAQVAARRAPVTSRC